MGKTDWSLADAVVRWREPTTSGPQDSDWPPQGRVLSPTRAQGSERGAWLMASQRPPPGMASDDHCSAWTAQQAANRKRIRSSQANQLIGVIEAQIIPRLLMLSQTSSLPSAREAPPAIDQAHIEELARLAVHHDASVIESFVQGIHGRGISTDQILLELLSPAAKLIGRLWEADKVSFIDVTVALTRLQQLVRTLRPADGYADTGPHAVKSRVLLLPTPGEQHTFGLIVVADMIRAAGFVVSGGYDVKTSERRKLLNTYPFVLVGFSLSCDTLLPALEQAIESVRRSPLNRRACVVVGGRLFQDNPEAVKQVGADGVALDGRHAVEMAQSLAGSAEH